MSIELALFWFFSAIVVGAAVDSRFAFGAWATARHPGRPIVLGRDSRVSGPMFTRIVHGALQSVGCTVIDVGMAPTPTVQLAVEHHHAAGGLAITASHNPIEWNALKFIGPSGRFLSAQEGADMRALLDAGIPRATWDQLGEVVTDEGAVERHVRQLLALPWLDVAGILPISGRPSRRSDGAIQLMKIA